SNSTSAILRYRWNPEMMFRRIMSGSIRFQKRANRTRARKAVAVAAKAPQPGRGKTRLIPDLTPEEAAELYTCFLKDTFELAESLPGVDVFIAYYPFTAEADFRDVFGCQSPLRAQRGKDLGERIYNIMGDLVREGYEAALVMGSDSPNLPIEYLESAIAELARDGDRIVLGPASDGGYYLIGAKTPRRSLFQEIEWSGPHVFEQTLARARELQIEVSLLPEWYDVDTPDDLERL